MKKQPEKKPTHNFEPLEKPTWEMTATELETHQNEMDAAIGWSAGAPAAPATATPNAEPLEDEEVDENGDLIERFSPTDYRTLKEVQDEEAGKMDEAE